MKYRLRTLLRIGTITAAAAFLLVLIFEVYQSDIYYSSINSSLPSRVYSSLVMAVLCLPYCIAVGVVAGLAVSGVVALASHFSIRDVLFLTTVIALSIGWWLDHRRLANQNSRDAKTIKTQESELQNFEKWLLDAQDKSLDEPIFKDWAKERRQQRLGSAPPGTRQP